MVGRMAGVQVWCGWASSPFPSGCQERVTTSERAEAVTPQCPEVQGEVMTKSNGYPCS